MLSVQDSYQLCDICVTFIVEEIRFSGNGINETKCDNIFLSLTRQAIQIIFSFCLTCKADTRHYRPIRFQEHYIASSAISGGLPRA